MPAEEDMARLLESMGVEKFEPRVIQQLLEFAHQYSTNIFADAAQFAEHSGREQLQCEDVQLAARLQATSGQITPPQLLESMAKERNKLPIRAPRSAAIEIPQPQLCLVEKNWQYVLPQETPVAPQSDATAERSAPARQQSSHRIAINLGGSSSGAGSASQEPEPMALG